MDQIISPAGRLAGAVRLPGDKSISHRYAILAALAEGRSRIANFSTGADCHSTLGCMRALGVPIEVEGTCVQVDGVGLEGLRAPVAVLDAGNSGSTIRMLSGVLAAQPFASEITGDGSLLRRPMRRIMDPLRCMGARIEARDDNFPPLRITGGALRGIDYELPVPSAQVKTAVLLAGIFAEGETIVREPVRTRDHTEIALAEMGAKLEVRRGVIRLQPRPRLAAQELAVPADLSSAAFFLAAAVLVPGSEVTIQGVGLNPTRATLLDVLAAMGAAVKVTSLSQQNGELVGDLEVRSSALRGGVIEGATAAAVIDEIPVLAVLGAASERGLVVRNAAELRVKESDRVASVAENLRRMGVEVREFEDGFEVTGRGAKLPVFRAAEIESFGDHRIAMAFSVAAVAADGPCTIHGAESAGISFPEFYATLESLRA